MHFQSVKAGTRPERVPMLCCGGLKGQHRSGVNPSVETIWSWHACCSLEFNRRI